MLLEQVHLNGLVRLQSIQQAQLQSVFLALHPAKAQTYRFLSLDRLQPDLGRQYLVVMYLFPEVPQ